MSTLRRVGFLFARFVALAVLLLGSWMFILNTADVRYEGLTLVWILVSGLAGTAGGVLYLLSIDGPERYRTRIIRTAGWAMMLAAMVLPSSASSFLLPAVALLIPTLFVNPKSGKGRPITSS